MQKYTLEEVITRLEDRVPGEPISHLGLAAVAHLRDQVTRIAFLKRELNQLSQQWDVLHEHTDELEAASAAKDARIADLEAALAPFLRDQFEPGQFYSDAYHMLVSVRLGDIRRARAAVAAKPDPNYTTPRRPTDTVAMKPKEAGQ